VAGEMQHSALGESLKARRTLVNWKGEKIIIEKLCENNMQKYKSVVNQTRDLSSLRASITPNQPKILYSPRLPASLVDLRERLAFYLDTTAAGRWWEIFDTLLNTLFFVSYIIQTGLDWHGLADQHIYQIIDLSMAAVLLSQFLPHLYISFDRFGTICSMFSLLTFASTLPVFYAFVNPVSGTFFGIGNIVYWFV
jgi:hypothetical protein